MQIGYIGLGKMGQNMVERLLKKGHEVVVFDVSKKAVTSMQRKGANGVASLAELGESLNTPQIVWIMVPHQAVNSVLAELLPHLRRGAVVVDGGNSPYEQSMDRARKLKKKGLTLLDVGVSGGPSGARDGACLMVGGETQAYKKLEPLFKDLAVQDGHAHVGMSGAGHFVKMVHNGIEYGMMQSFAEGFDVLAKHRTFKLDLQQIAALYSHGSVITSRMSVWLEDAFRVFGRSLKNVGPCAVGTGEGEWTVKAAKHLNVQTPVIARSVKARKQCDASAPFQGKIIMALRNRFGGHDPKPDKT